MIIRPVIVAALLLGGCATTARPVDVTRFSLAADVARGTIAATGAATLEQSRYDAAVAGELSRLGFAAADPASARYLFSAEVTRDTRAALARRSPVTIGIGGGTGGYGGGVGLGASFGLGGRPRDTVATRLAVRLTDRVTRQVVWEGRAEGDAASGSANASPGDGVDRLARALFQDFPGQSGRTISVP